MNFEFVEAVKFHGLKRSCPNCGEREAVPCQYIRYDPYNGDYDCDAPEASIDTCDNCKHIFCDECRKKKAKIGETIECETEGCTNTFVKKTGKHRFCRTCQQVRSKQHSKKGNEKHRKKLREEQKAQEQKAVKETETSTPSGTKCKCPSCKEFHYMEGYENSKVMPHVYCSKCNPNRNRSLYDGQIYHCL